MKKLIEYIFIFTVVCVISLQTQNVKAAWGDFDASFGFLGVSVDTLYNYRPVAVAVQPDGKILVTGYRKLINNKERFFLRRYLPSGQPDNSFGNNSLAVSNAFIAVDGNYYGVSIAVRPNGKIAVAGAGNGFYAVWQFNSNGTSDPSVGYGGFRSLSNYPTRFGEFTDSGYPQLAVQSSKLIIGIAKSGSNAMTLLRLNGNGSVDSGFGNQGESATEVLGTLTVESASGNIAVGGNHHTSVGYSHSERKLPNGQNDPGYVSEDTTVGTIFSKFFGGFIRLPDGKYVARHLDVYYPQPPSFPPSVRLLKFGENGALETTIFQTAEVGDYYGNKCPDVLARQGDGKVVFGGWSKIHRFSGELDPGTEETAACSSFVSLTGKTRGVLQADDKMIVAGTYNNYLAVVRVRAD